MTTMTYVFAQLCGGVEGVLLLPLVFSLLFLRTFPQVQAIVIVVANGMFCGGFNIDIFTVLQNGSKHEVDEVMRSGVLKMGGTVMDELVEGSRKPEVAAIQVSNRKNERETL